MLPLKYTPQAVDFNENFLFLAKVLLNPRSSALKIVQLPMDDSLNSRLITGFSNSRHHTNKGAQTSLQISN